ncbi:MAG: hypothetical protein ACLPND_16745 [Candidatus Korobacteraceae bacterium]
MKKLLFAGAVSLMVLPMLATAQSPFDGTWKFDVNSMQFDKKPDEYLLQNGMYDCKTCKPPISIKADGSDQKVTGHPYFDTMSVKAADDHNVEMTTKRDGKVVGTEKDSISSDGKTLTINWTDSGQPSGGPQMGTFMMIRVKSGPAGANLISGSWRAEKAQQSTESGLLWTFKISGDQVKMTNPTGQSYTAKLDGSDAPYKGDPGITSVSVKMHGKDTLEETDKRDGKVIYISRMTVTPDGKTMKIVYDDKLHGTTTKGDAMKQ